MERFETALLLIDSVEGAREPAGEALLLHEPSGHGHLAVRPIRIRPGIYNNVRGGEILALRMAQPPPLRDRQRSRQKPVLSSQLVLVYNRDSYAARVGSESKGTMM